MNEAIWIDKGRIITRNADGGTTAWSEAEAVTLHKRLGVILRGFDLIPPTLEKS